MNERMKRLTEKNMSMLDVVSAVCTFIVCMVVKH